MSSLRKRVNAELDILRRKNNGLLKQDQIVAYARDPNTALHEDFDRQGLWDDSHAAETARLAYAGQIIRLYVIKPVDDQAAPVRAMVSLIDDRKVKSGLPGYRYIEDVLNDTTLRANLLQTALMELRAFRRKYESIKELAVVWDAIDAVDDTRPREPLADVRYEQRPEV